LTTPSGTYGGPALDAVTVLSRLIAALHDDDGTAAVPGLISKEQGGPKLDENEFRTDAGIKEAVRLAGTGSLPSRLWTRPAGVGVR
jgi:hypothetical protein